MMPTNGATEGEGAPLVPVEGSSTRKDAAIVGQAAREAARWLPRTCFGEPDRTGSYIYITRCQLGEVTSGIFGRCELYITSRLERGK